MKPQLKSWIYVLIALACLLLFSSCSAVDEEANKKLMARIGRTTVTVYPTVVRQSGITYDQASADSIAAELKSKQWATPTQTSEQVSVASGWKMNQSRLFRESEQSFAQHVRAHPLKTDYALMAEYLLGPNRAGGIHCYVVDAEGRLAAGVGLNSHHRIFSEADSRNIEDCTKVLLKALNTELTKKGRKEE